MRYVAYDPEGVMLQGVKELPDATVEGLKKLGFRFKPYRDDRLSRAASAIWRQRTADPDPYDAMGYDADCGPAIDAGHRRAALRAVKAAGYDSPGEYNADLRARMVLPGGRVTYRVYELLSILEIESVCPRCGQALDVSHQYTRNYGGGYDTFERCPNCGWAEVYV